MHISVDILNDSIPVSLSNGRTNYVRVCKMLTDYVPDILDGIN